MFLKIWHFFFHCFFIVCLIIQNSFVFRKCFLLLLLFLLLLKYLYLNSKFFPNKIVIKWHFVVLFHKYCCVFDNCKIKHWTYIICSFNFFHFFLFYWAYSRSDLMLCLFAIDAFICDFYFVFIASIRLVIFYTIIAFLDIFAHFFNVIIFVAIEALNYSTFSRKYYRVLFIFFLQKFFCDNSINFFREFCFYNQRKICFFQSFHIFRSCHSNDVQIFMKHFVLF